MRMTFQEIKKIAEAKKVILDKSMVKNDIIRAIQRHEGNDDCYASGRANECGQMNCLWRQDCLTKK